MNPTQGQQPNAIQAAQQMIGGQGGAQPGMGGGANPQVKQQLAQIIQQLIQLVQQL